MQQAPTQQTPEQELNKDLGEASAEKDLDNHVPTPEELNRQAELTFNFADGYWQTELGKNVPENFVFSGEKHHNRRLKLHEMDDAINESQPDDANVDRNSLLVDRMKLLITQGFADLASYRNYEGGLISRLSAIAQSAETGGLQIDQLKQAAHEADGINRAVAELGKYLSGVSNLMREYSRMFPAEYHDLFKTLFLELEQTNTNESVTGYELDDTSNYDFVARFDKDADHVAGQSTFATLHARLTEIITELQTPGTDKKDNKKASDGKDGAAAPAAPVEEQVPQQQVDSSGGNGASGLTSEQVADPGLVDGGLLYGNKVVRDDIITNETLTAQPADADEKVVEVSVAEDIEEAVKDLQKPNS